jgi:hypothetical protein
MPTRPKRPQGRLVGTAKRAGDAPVKRRSLPRPAWKAVDHAARIGHAHRPGIESAAMSTTMVPGYRHLPGSHCGSTALRNLLAFHGTELSEEMALGLGAGACFYYAVLPDQSPSRFLSGRVLGLEESFLELTDLPLRFDRFSTPEDSWKAARAAIDAGRPALLLTDLYHLDHYGSSAHFPGHAVVLAGYDPDVAYLSDTAFTELQVTRLESLARARHGSLPMFPLDGQMLTVPERPQLPDPRVGIERAIERAVRQMLEPEIEPYQGLPALRRLAADVGAWPEAAADWQWCARFGYQVIERRGTGGGNFRRMYARFLDEVAAASLTTVGEAPRLAAQAAERWTGLAEALLAASDRDEPDPALWDRAGSEASRVLEAEEALWRELSEATGRQGRRGQATRRAK